MPPLPAVATEVHSSLPGVVLACRTIAAPDPHEPLPLKAVGTCVQLYTLLAREKIEDRRSLRFVGAINSRNSPASGVVL